MHNFVDSYQNLFDVNGKFLVGRLTFLEPNTSSSKLTIYDTDGNELDNPIYTSQYGLPKYQIMLQDRDYKVTFEMYIGQGNMESDENESNWLLYKTITSVNGILTTSQQSATPTFIDTVEQMKAMSGMQDGDTCIVKGYFDVGDSGAERLYVWHQNGNYTDDGGVIIKSNNSTSGAWIMVIQYNYIDVRWYGDIPDASAKPTVQTSNLGQRSRAAHAANMYDKHLYFAARQSTISAASYYIFDGSNTVSLDQDIICDSAVRFVVKEGTTGTAVTCKTLQKPTKHLFVSESPQQTIGGYTLTADWINTSWLSSNDVIARNARLGYVIDMLKSPVTFNDCMIKVERDSINMACTFNNCDIVECHKQIAISCTMQNMVVKTNWFADDYNYSNLTVTGCTILLHNCKDANTYIVLKNRQNDPNYGDLGEQSINATVLTGGTIENCYGTITVSGSGSLELNNVSLTVNGLGSTNTINAVDSWLTFGTETILRSIQMRRGSLAGNALTLISDSMIENCDIRTLINTTGIKLVVRNSEIHSKITTRNIDLINNQIYAEIDQSDLSGIVYVKATGNMFHTNEQNVPAQHYVHADTVDSVVQGIWISNGSSYDTAHWIKLDRTNLKEQDNDHQYTYAKNAEPYLMKWSGRNRPLMFKKYGGYWTDPQKGVGIYSTMTIPFLFLNYRDRLVYAVPRQLYWKAFTVGRGYLARTGQIKSTNIRVGIAEGDYVDYKNGTCSVFWTWGSRRYQSNSILNGQSFGAAPMVSRDGTGLAEYNVSFEQADEVHGEYSYGTEVGNLPSTDWQSSSDVTAFPTYPSQSFGNAFLFIMMDPDFSTGTNPGEVS